MKKAKYIGIIFLSIVMAIMFAISANAKKVSLKRALDDKPADIRIARFMVAHPKEFSQLILDLDRGETTNLNQYTVSEYRSVTVH